MPYITIESGALSDEQKEELIRRQTEVSSEIMNVPQEFFVTTIKKVSDKNFGIDEKTIDKVKAKYKARKEGTDMLNAIPSAEEMATLVGQPLFYMQNNLCALIDENY